MGAAGWTLTIKNLFLPVFCQSCGMRLLTEENGFFCPTCWEASRRIDRPFCTVCGRPQIAAVGMGGGPNFPCGPCSQRTADDPIRRTFGAAVYADAIGEAIKLFKFQGKRRLVHPLAEVMVEFAEREMNVDAYTTIEPVPLYRVRRRERGFNQSQLLARAIKPAFPNAKVSSALDRVRPTRVQSRLKSADERRKNVRGAFQVTDVHALRGERVLLVDDVITTGGTVTECAKVLRTAGAESVDVFAVALSELSME
jgi:ComF family protein